jgi:hypothetical protein
MNGIIFFASLSGYNLVLEEDGQTNRVTNNNGIVRDPYNTPFHAPMSKVDGETPSRIRTWNLIFKEKKPLFSLRKLPCNCEVRIHSMCKDMVVNKKRIIIKIEGHGGEAQQVAGPK